MYRMYIEVMYNVQNVHTGRPESVLLDVEAIWKIDKLPWLVPDLNWTVKLLPDIPGVDVAPSCAAVLPESVLPNMPAGNGTREFRDIPAAIYMF